MMEYEYYVEALLVAFWIKNIDVLCLYFFFIQFSLELFPLRQLVVLLLAQIDRQGQRT